MAGKRPYPDLLYKVMHDPCSHPWQVRRDDTIDLLHGVSIPDPYRWLEDPDSPETAACEHR